MNEKARPNCRLQLLDHTKAEKPKHPQCALSSVKHEWIARRMEIIRRQQVLTLEPNPWNKIARGQIGSYLHQIANAKLWELQSSLCWDQGPKQPWDKANTKKQNAKGKNTLVNRQFCGPVGKTVGTGVFGNVFAYNWSFLLTAWAFLLRFELLCIQWESVSKKHLNGLQAKKLKCKQIIPTASKKTSPPNILGLPPSFRRGDHTSVSTALHFKTLDDMTRLWGNWCCNMSLLIPNPKPSNHHFPSFREQAPCPRDRCWQWLQKASAHKTKHWAPLEPWCSGH